MRFRFRLALVFLLLSAFPLTLLALYSFTTSSRALRQAAEAEAKLMARELEQRVEGVSAEIDQSVKALARLPASYWLHAGTETGENGDAKVGAQLSNFNQYATPNKAAKAYITPADLANGAIYPSAEMMTKLEFVNELGDVNKLYDEVWTQVKSK